jgi:hypothetical protein
VSRAPGSRSRWGWRARALAGLALLALIGWVGLAWASAAKADLRDAEEEVDARWAVLRQTLDQRYLHMTNLVAALAPIVGAGTDPIPSATADLATWNELVERRATDDGSELVEEEVAVATRLEGEAGRLLAIAASTERLRADDGVAGTAAAVANTTIALPAAAYNDAVADYARERERFPARALVGIYDFEPRHPLALPAPPGQGSAATTTTVPGTPVATTAAPVTDTTTTSTP